MKHCCVYNSRVAATPPYLAVLQCEATEPGPLVLGAEVCSPFAQGVPPHDAIMSLHEQHRQQRAANELPTSQIA